MATETKTSAVSAEATLPRAGEPASAHEVASKLPRRNFFGWMTAALGAVAAAMIGVPVVSYFLRFEKKTPPWVDLGGVDEFPPEQTRAVAFTNPLSTPWDGMTALTNVFVRYQGRDQSGADSFLVLSANCAHLGCPVSWFPQSGLFMCPCHGGVYYANGDRASGPPPRGLFACVWRVTKGRLEIQAPHFPTESDPLEEHGENNSAGKGDGGGRTRV